MDSVASELPPPEVFIRCGFESLKGGRKGLDKGIAFSKLEALFQEVYGFSSIETVNAMLVGGALVAAREARGATQYIRQGMARPELVEGFSLEEVGGKYPMLYLPSKLPNSLKRVVEIRQQKAEIIRKALAESVVAPQGDEKVLRLADFRGKEKS